MGYLRVLFFFSSMAVAYVSAGVTYGQSKTGTEMLTERGTFLFAPSTVKFNRDKKHDLTIDKVEINYDSRDTISEIVSGGIGTPQINIRVTPDPKIISDGLRAVVTVYGRMHLGKIESVNPGDIKFE